MRWNVASSCAWHLYVIVDLAAVGQRDPAAVGAAAVRGGADAIQLRDKSGTAERLVETVQRLLPVTRRAGIPRAARSR